MFVNVALLGLVLFHAPTSIANPVSSFTTRSSGLAPVPSTTSTPLPSPSCAGTPQDSEQRSFHQGDAKSIIQQFCKRYVGATIVPMVSLGTGWSKDRPWRENIVEHGFPIPGDDNLWLSVSFSQDTCMGKFTFDQNACTDAMTSILKNCNKDTNDAGKYGGKLQNVCAVYRMTGRRASDQHPPWPSTDSGDFTCKDTDTSAIGGASSPLANTCQCWFSKIPGVTDTFKKPSNGKCDGKDVDRNAFVTS